MPCEVTLLGTPEIRVSGVVQHHVRHKTLALIAFLLVEDRPIRRDTLAALLWPDSGQSFARRNLRTCIHNARQALGDQAFRMTDDVVRLDPSVVRSDIHRLRQLESSERYSARCSDPDAFLTRALLGGFMEGFSLPDSEAFDTWQLQTGESCRTRLVRIARERVEVALDEGRSDQVLELGRAIVRSDPLDEADQALLLKVLAAAGEWSAATRQYESFRTTLLTELGETPSPEIAEIARQIATRDSKLGPTRPERRHSASPSGALPEESDPLYGRDNQLDQLELLLVEEDRRMVTLAGVGGAGKTRLAVHFGHRAQNKFPNGIVFVDLTRIASPGQLLSLVQTSAGARERIADPEESFAALARQLDQRRTLVILDNFEHVIDAAEIVGRLVAATRTVCFLATSREALRIHGECVIPVPPLPVPSFEGVEGVRESPAARLFADRVRQIDRGFSITERNAEAIHTICEWLDGLPLALELAVPLLRLYSPAELVRRVGSPLQIGETGRRDAPPRHQSLQQALDWSYNLLSSPERRLFAELSVFESDFTVEAVERVCATASSGPSPQRILGALIEKNLLRARETPHGWRFGMLETMRDYSRRVADPQTTQRTRCRHADYYRRLAVVANEELHGPEQIEWQHRLLLDLPNLLAALTALDDSGRWQEGLELATGLTWFWYRAGYLRTGRDWLRTMLARSSRTPSPTRAQGLFGLGWLTFVMGDWRAARTHYRESIAMSRTTADLTTETTATAYLGVCERWLGEEDAGWRRAERAIELGRTAPGRFAYMSALLCRYATSGGEFEGNPPLDELQRCIDIGLQWGDLWPVAHFYNGLGDAHAALGNCDDARAAYIESHERFEPFGDRYMMAWNLEGLGRVERSCGNDSRALEHTAAAIELFDALGDELDVALMIARFAEILAQCDDRVVGAVGLLAGAATTILHRLESDTLGHAPQVRLAVQRLSGYAARYPGEFESGLTLNRSDAVALVYEMRASPTSAATSSFGLPSWSQSPKQV